MRARLKERPFGPAIDPTDQSQPGLTRIDPPRGVAEGLAFSRGGGLHTEGEYLYRSAKAPDPDDRATMLPNRSA